MATEFAMTSFLPIKVAKDDLQVLRCEVKRPIWNSRHPVKDGQLRGKREEPCCAHLNFRESAATAEEWVKMSDFASMAFKAAEETEEDDDSAGFVYVSPEFSEGAMPTVSERT